QSQRAGASPQRLDLGIRYEYLCPAPLENITEFRLDVTILKPDVLCILLPAQKLITFSLDLDNVEVPLDFEYNRRTPHPSINSFPNMFKISGNSSSFACVLCGIYLPLLRGVCL